MSTKAFFPCEGGSNLILGTGTENHICILRTPAIINFFHQILKKWHFGVKKKKHYPLRCICIVYIWSPTWFHGGIIISQGVLTKFNFWQNFHIWKKIVNLMKALKYEHQSIFPLWGRVKLNLRDRYRKPNIVFNNSSCYQFCSSNSQKLSLWCKKKSFFTHMDLYDPYIVPYTIL